MGFCQGFLTTIGVTFASFSPFRYSACLNFVLSTCRITANRLLTALRTLRRSIYLPLYAPEWADLPGDRQFGNYFTIYIALDLTCPDDREGGNYLTHFLGQKIMKQEEYDC